MSLLTVEKLKKLKLDHHLNDHEIATRFNLSPNRIRKLCHKHKITPPVFNEGEKIPFDNEEVKNFLQLKKPTSKHIQEYTSRYALYGNNPYATGNITCEIISKEIPTIFAYSPITSTLALVEASL